MKMSKGEKAVLHITSDYGYVIDEQWVHTNTDVIIHIILLH